MVYPSVKRCVDCKWSATVEGRDWELKCTHPLVNQGDPYYLSYGTKTIGSDCTRQRDSRSWRAACGIKGKLFELLQSAGV
jgi:hypothetical protein